MTARHRCSSLRWKAGLSAAVVALAVGGVIWLGVAGRGPQLAGHRSEATTSPGGSASRPSSGTTASPSPSGSSAPAPNPSDSAYLAARPQGPPTFTATFAGSQLDTSVWGTCYPGDDPTVGCTNFGNSDEYEWYLGSQDQVSGGVLRLIAEQTATSGLTQDGSAKEYDCRSGIVTTYSGFHFEYGFLQVEANVPHTPGLWPSLWLGAVDGQWPPEMDLVENWSGGLAAATFHPSPGSLPAVMQYFPPSLAYGWQTYSLYWTSSELEFFVGETLVLTITANVPQQEMYFIADLAEYQAPAQGNCSGEMDIRSLQYWSS